MHILSLKDVNREHLTHGKHESHINGCANWFKKTYIKEYVNLFNYLSSKLENTGLTVLDSEYLFNITVDKINDNGNELHISDREVDYINQCLIDYVSLDFNWSIESYESPVTHYANHIVIEIK